MKKNIHIYIGTFMQVDYTCNNQTTQTSVIEGSTPGRRLMSNLTWGSASFLSTTPSAISDDGNICNTHKHKEILSL
jgi:hypothetical protein